MRLSGVAKQGYAVLYGKSQLTKLADGYTGLPYILLDELRESTRMPYWEITGFTPSEFAKLHQLIIYARPYTKDYNKILMSSVQTGVLTERFVPGYSRYVVSFRNEKKIFGLISFDGNKLRSLRERNATAIEDYRGVIDNTFCFPFKKSRLRFFSRIQTFVMVWRLQKSGVIADLRKRFAVPEICVRSAAIHRNAWGCVLNGNVGVQIAGSDVNQDCIRKYCRQIVRKTLSAARKNTSFNELSRYLPLGYVRIAVFCKDHRRRRLP